MFTMLTVIRKRLEVSTEQFRHFREFEYGPTYAALPQIREYVQYYLTDTVADGAEDPIDAIVRISFDSPEQMREALAADSYRQARAKRQAFMRETSVGIHSAIVDQTVTLVHAQQP